MSPKKRAAKNAASRSLRVALLVLMGLAACKSGKDTQTAVEAEPKRPASPSGTMSLQGYYSLVGSVGTFEVCGTGQRWRVAREGDIAALEQAYRESSVPPGSVLLVDVEGGIDWRPTPDGAGKEMMLIVARLVGSSPGKTCPQD